MECIAPIRIRSRTPSEFRTYGEFHYVPCGRCPACIDNKRNQWIARIKMEEKNSFSAYFVTLTYAEEYLPRNKYGNPCFSKRDFQLFMKRLRKALSIKTDIPVNIRHFTVGEYGSQFGRPHYHSILFNLPSFGDTWRLISKCWPYGRISVSLLNGRRIGYVCNYMYGKSDMPNYQITDDNKLPFMCSKRPGIGSNYNSEAVRQWHVNHLDKPFMRVDGQFYSLPRYYLDKIFDEKQLKRYKILKQLYIKQLLESEDYHKYHGEDVTDYVRRFYQRVKKHKQSNVLHNDKL